MSECNCVKEDTLIDIKDRLVKLENNDREDFGSIKELTLGINMFRESSERQTNAITDISQAMIQVKDNLSLMNKEIKDTNNRIDNIEVKIEKNDDLNKIDIREIQKSKFTDKLKIYGIPIGAIAGAIVGLVEILKAFNIIK